MPDTLQVLGIKAVNIREKNNSGWITAEEKQVNKQTNSLVFLIAQSAVQKNQAGIFGESTVAIFLCLFMGNLTERAAFEAAMCTLGWRRWTTAESECQALRARLRGARSQGVKMLCYYYSDWSGESLTSANKVKLLRILEISPSLNFSPQTAFVDTSFFSLTRIISRMICHTSKSPLLCSLGQHMY